MIMLSDVTGEVFRQTPFQSKAFKSKSISGVSDLWGAGHQVSSCLQRPLRRRQPARRSGSKRGEFSVNQFPSQASYITSNLHQLPVDMDTADEVADLLRCEEHQELFLDNHRLVVQGCHLHPLDGRGRLSRRRHKAINLTSKSICNVALRDE